MLYTEQPDSPNHIGSLGVFDPSTAPGGSVTFDELVDYLAKRVHLGKAFRRRLVRVPLDLADPWWVEDANFDLEYHLRHAALPSPGNWKQLCTLVGRLHSRPLDLSRPPWEVWMIEGLNDLPGVPAGSFAMLIRVHHTAIDGVGGMELLGALLQTAPGDPPPDTIDDWEPDRMPGQWELLGRAALTNAVRPVRLARGAVNAVPAAIRAVNRLRNNEIELPKLSVPATRFNTKVSPHRVFDSATFDLDDVRRMKAAVPGATVNDAVITIIAGGLRTYLGDLGELPEGSLAAVCPMSVRVDDDKGNEGNKVAQFFCDMHTDVADPKERLAAVSETTRVAKESQKALGGHALMQISSVLPGALFGMALRANAEIGARSRSSGLLNTQISNVPGPPFPLYCADSRLVSMHGMGPVITGAALIHVVMSYCGIITFSFTSDRGILPQPEDYTAALRRSFEELKAATTD